MNNGKIYCIGTDKKVYNFYYQNGACQFDALVANQNALVDARGGLTFDQTGKVFVIGTDGKVYLLSDWERLGLRLAQGESVSGNRRSRQAAG